MILIQILLFHLILDLALSFHSIDDYGAIPNVNSNDAAHANTMAMVKALSAANQDPSDREVLLPKGNTYYVFNMTATNLVNVIFRIEGTYIVSDNISEWENIMGHPPPIPEVHSGSLNIWNSTNITITGGGSIIGQGYTWWIYVWFNGSHADHRPYLVHMVHCKDIEIYNLYLKNSPYYHLNLEDMLNVHIHDIDIHVDIDKQKELLKKFGGWNKELDLPTFPLNTDGIDPSGKNFLIENVKMDLFDDAVAVKPSNSAPGRYSNCSQDMVVRNVTTLFTVGMAIGSLTNDPLTNCIRNITFENITMYLPLKGIHVKTNPKTSDGIGIIDSITYRNMHLIGSIWMPIYIGPQQQQQPGTSGTGCSWLYPIKDQCPTNPNVQISNILLEDITLEGSLLWPGTINCDPESKCKNMTFKNVYNSGPFLLMPIYECHYAEGIKSGSNLLPLECLDIDSGNQNIKPLRMENPYLKLREVFPSSKLDEIGSPNWQKLKELKIKYLQN
uniref:Polygalacturonase n=1 Tax=Acrobeloides nanus TaxID=290746 RepID=A0A914EP65_9BILA